MPNRLQAAVRFTPYVDHIGSNFRFDEIYFHEDDREIFSLHTDPAYIGGTLLQYTMPYKGAKALAPLVKKLLTPNSSGNYRYITDGHVFSLGGRDIQAFQTPGHTPGSICLLDRKRRMLFTGDTLCEWGVLLDLAGACPPETFLASVQRLKKMANSFDKSLPGHHGWPVDNGYIDEYEACAAGIVSKSANTETEGNRRFAKHGRVRIAISETESP